MKHQTQKTRRMNKENEISSADIAFGLLMIAVIIVCCIEIYLYKIS